MLKLLNFLLKPALHTNKTWKKTQRKPSHHTGKWSILGIRQTLAPTKGCQYSNK